MKLHKIVEVVIEGMNYLLTNVPKFHHLNLLYRRGFTGI
jgi:hypothetical protein